MGQPVSVISDKEEANKGVGSLFSRWRVRVRGLGLGCGAESRALLFLQIDTLIATK